MDKIITTLKNEIEKHDGIFIKGLKDTIVSYKKGFKGNIYDALVLEYVAKNFSVCIDKFYSQTFNFSPNEINRLTDIVVTTDKTKTRPLQKIHDDFCNW